MNIARHWKSATALLVTACGIFFSEKSGAILLGFPDTTQDAHLFVEKRRLENGELDGVHPKIIIILAGINNVGTEPAGNEDWVCRRARGGVAN